MRPLWLRFDNHFWAAIEMYPLVLKRGWLGKPRTKWACQWKIIELSGGFSNTPGLNTRRYNGKIYTWGYILGIIDTTWYNQYNNSTGHVWKWKFFMVYHTFTASFYSGHTLNFQTDVQDSLCSELVLWGRGSHVHKMGPKCSVFHMLMTHGWFRVPPKNGLIVDSW